MSIRMTSAMRETIADAVYKATAIPTKLTELEAAIKAFFHAWALAQVPADFIQATKGLPKNWLAHRSFINAVAGTNFHNPKPVQHGWSIQVKFNDPILVPNDFQFAAFTLADLNKHPNLQTLLDQVVVAQEQNKNIKAEIKATLAAYSTVEKLIKDFPEFAKHCPEKPVYALTVNPDKVIHSLMNAGFDITTRPVVAVAPKPVKPIKVSKPVGVVKAKVTKAKATPKAKATTKAVAKVKRVI